MEKKYLIVNPGSASRKYAVYLDGIEIFRTHFERENGGFVVAKKNADHEEKIKISEREFDESAEKTLAFLIADGIIADKNEISAVGFRIVASGDYFIKTKLIDGEYVKKLTEVQEMAPLHISAALSEIQKFTALIRGVPFVGVSDSAFHATMPEKARLYALPIEITRELGIYRFGYHGISVQSVLRTARELIGKIPSRIIVCHLGSGSSITAVKDGKCLDTSMGFTPLEGAVMGTRPGDIDAGALIYLAKKLNLSPGELDEFLNHKCGLFGLSGKTNDVRELIALSEKGDENAKLALEIFVYRVQKYIGAYFAALGGLDLLVFTAAIGERSAIIRDLICQGLGALGIKIDGEKNSRMVEKDGFIETGESAVKIAAIKTDEMAEIAREMINLNRLKARE